MNNYRLIIDSNAKHLQWLIKSLQVSVPLSNVGYCIRAIKHNDRPVVKIFFLMLLSLYVGNIGHPIYTTILKAINDRQFLSASLY